MAGPIVRGDLDVTRNVSARRLQQGAGEVATSSTEYLLSVTREYQTVFTGSNTQTVRLPQVSSDTRSAGVGTEYRLTNESTGVVTLQHATADSPSLTNNTISAGRSVIVFCIALGSTPATLANGKWVVIHLDPTVAAGRSDPYPQNIGFDLSAMPVVNDWGTLNMTTDEYTITIAATTHGKNPNPNITVYNSVGEEVLIEKIINISSGDIQIRVNGTPDGRFAGRLRVY